MGEGPGMLGEKHGRCVRLAGIDFGGVRDHSVCKYPFSNCPLVAQRCCFHVKGAGFQGERFLMRNKSTTSFAIIRYNLRTYEPGGVMAIIKGRGKAEVTVRHFESGQSREDSLAGWGYFLEKTDLKPGMDPQKATSLRQTRMDIRESKGQDPTLVNRLDNLLGKRK